MQCVSANVAEEPVQPDTQAGSLRACNLEYAGSHPKAGVSGDDFGARHPLCELSPASTGELRSFRDGPGVCRINIAHLVARRIGQRHRCTKMSVEVAVCREDVELIRRVFLGLRAISH